MLDVPSHYTTERITTNGTALCCYRTGTAKPTLLMAHGMTDMGLCWTRVADALKHKYQIVLYDARGHGQSDSSEDGHDPERRGEDLYQICTALGLKDLLLLGHSMGAVTVALLAARHPELVRAVVMEDPPVPHSLAEPPSNAQIQAYAEQWARWKNDAVKNRSRTREELVTQCRRQSPLWHDAEIGPWATAKLLVNPDVYNTPNLCLSDWWKQLDNIRCPQLLVTADTARGALVNETVGEQLREAFPDNATLVRLPGAGHSVHREQFDRFMSLTTDFFARS